jgi:hypothetical protein
MSTNFLKVILEEQFDVNIFWDDYWQGGDPLSLITINKYDYVVFFQTLLPFYKLKKIKAKIVWVPMLDGVKLSNQYWSCLSSIPIKILAFSEYLHKKCSEYNIQSLSLKYYLPPTFSNDLPKKGRHFFFWYRGGITFAEIKTFLDFQKVDSFIYRSAPDPFHKEENFLTDDFEKYKLQIFQDLNFDSQEKYLELLKKANIFIAPRKIEGIGISFLEAMALGMVVIGYNYGTMNEYIKHNYNGYLFDSKIHNINFDNLEEVLKNSRTMAMNGWEKWENDIKNINEFILNEDYRKIKINKLYFSIYSIFQLFESYLRRTIKRKLKKIKGRLRLNE